MKLQIRIPLKTAILAGLEPGDREIEISPSEIPTEKRGLLADYLSKMRRLPLETEGETLADFIAAIERQETEKRAATSRKEAEAAAKAAAARQLLDGPAAPLELFAFEDANLKIKFSASNQYSKVGVPFQGEAELPLWKLGVCSGPLAEECAARNAALTARNQAKADALADEARGKRAAAVAEAKAEAEKEAAAKKAALEKELASRRETGEIEFGWCSYNPKRCSAPWGATVSLVGDTLEYNWFKRLDDWTVRIPAQPGSVIAKGQKDNRNPNNTEHCIYLVGADFRLQALTRREAFELLQARQKAAQQKQAASAVA